MELTDKEIIALLWWINWTKETMDRKVAHSEEMERTGEVGRGYHQRELVRFHTVLHIAEKLKG